MKLPIVTKLLLVVLVSVWPIDGRSSAALDVRPTLQLFTDNVLGTYVGTVMDAGQPRHQVVTFSRAADGSITGLYTVSRDKESYFGWFDNCTIGDNCTLNFQWHDYAGQGVATLVFTPDGGSFKGNWGLAVVDVDLTLEGLKLAVDPVRGKRD